MADAEDVKNAGFNSCMSSMRMSSVILQHDSQKSMPFEYDCRLKIIFCKDYASLQRTATVTTCSLTVACCHLQVTP